MARRIGKRLGALFLAFLVSLLSGYVRGLLPHDFISWVIWEISRQVS